MNGNSLDYTPPEYAGNYPDQPDNGVYGDGIYGDGDPADGYPDIYYDNGDFYGQYYGENTEFTKYFYYQSFGFERVVYLYIWEIMVVLTTLANILVLLVLTRKSQRNATNVFLTAVAVSDSFTGISTLPTYIYAFNHYERDDLKLTEGWCEAFMISKLFVSKSFHTMSIWFTLCLVSQRFISVTWPFKAQSMFTIPKTLIMIAVVVFLSPILHVYHLHNKKAVNLKCAWQLGNPCEEGCVYLWATFFMMHFIPCTLIVVLTVLMILKMKQTEERLQESHLITNQKILKRRAAQNRRISVIVITVVIIFLVPEIPYGIFLLISVSLKHSGKELMDLDKNRAFHCAYEILLVLNFHANFWVYVAMNRKFRSGLKRTFIPCLAVLFRCLRICGIHKKIQRTPSVSSSSEMKIEPDHTTRTTTTSMRSTSIRSNQSIDLKTYRNNSIRQPVNNALEEIPSEEIDLEEKTYHFDSSGQQVNQIVHDASKERKDKVLKKDHSENEYKAETLDSTHSNIEKTTDETKKSLNSNQSEHESVEDIQNQQRRMEGDNSDKVSNNIHLPVQQVINDSESGANLNVGIDIQSSSGSDKPTSNTVKDKEDKGIEPESNTFSSSENPPENQTEVFNNVNGTIAVDVC